MPVERIDEVRLEKILKNEKANYYSDKRTTQFHKQAVIHQRSKMGFVCRNQLEKEV